MRDGEYADPAEVRRKYDPPTDEPLALVVQHPLTTATTDAGNQMVTTLDALSRLDITGVIIYPNADAGGKRMIDVIDACEGDGIYTFSNLPRQEFLAFIHSADVMVGNSSSGIIEAPSFDLLVVDIGPRQAGRQRTENALSVPHDIDAISEVMTRCLTDDAIRQ